MAHNRIKSVRLTNPLDRGARKRRSGATQRRRLLVESLEDRHLLAVTFEFSYDGAGTIGFNDAAEGSGFRSALESAAGRLGGWLLHDATVQMDVTSSTFDAVTFATAESANPTPPAEGGFVPGVVASKIIGLGDLNGLTVDGQLDVSFFGGGDAFTYVTDPADVDAANEIDFQAVMIHELIHAIGFDSATNASGADDAGNGLTNAGVWQPFDQFLSDADGNRLIDADSESATAFRMDTTASAWPIDSVGGVGPSAGLFFDGPMATAVHGSRVPLYSPATFDAALSARHLDSEGFPGGSPIFEPTTHLMSHLVIDNAVPQELTLLEKAILADIGINVQESTSPTITPPANVSIEGNATGGFSGSNQALEDFLGGAVAVDLVDPKPAVTHDAPAFLSFGQNSVTFLATDASGNTASATAVVTVIDTTPPDLAVSPTSVTLEATGPSGVTDVVLPFVPTVSDVVDANPLVTFDGGEDFPLGTTDATYTAEDFRDNTSTFPVQIIVQDTISPDFTLPASVNLTANTPLGADLSNATLAALLDSSASDLVDPSLTITSDPQTIPLGTTAVTFTATDDSGNATAVTTDVTVENAQFIVTTLDDELDANPETVPEDLSLREAISLANLTAGSDQITFAPALNGAVLLDAALGQLEISETVTITGPGKDVVTVDAQQNNRVLDITASSGDVLIDSITLTGGQVGADDETGGGIRFASAGTLTINDSIVTGNSTVGQFGFGGGIQAQSGDVVLTDTSVTNNYTNNAFSDGGGVWMGGGDLTLTRSTISGNSTQGATSVAGGLYSRFGSLTITDSTIADNHTETDNSFGGAMVLVSVNATLLGSTVSGNFTQGENASGGGIRNVLGSLTISNSTLSGNRTEASTANGAGIFANSATVNIFNSTVTANQSAGQGGGIGLTTPGSGVTLNIENSIVAGNTDDGTAPDFVGTSVAASALSVLYSLIGDNRGTTLSESQSPEVGTGNLIGDVSGTGLIDPMIGPLAENGGITLTHNLLEGSPAIDAGDPAFNGALFVPPLINDQRGDGFPRDLGNAVEMGAIEVPGDVTITWDNPDDIAFGMPLAAEQLDAIADAPGTFVYTPPLGTFLDAGDAQVLMVNFTPDDLTSFNLASATVEINVLKADPVITWSDPEDIVFGDGLTATQLNATTVVDGVLVYSPVTGTILNAGENQTLTVNFTPTDTANYNNVSASVSIDVAKADPTLTWIDPDGIVFGTALDATQLNATADIGGTFVYDPAAESVLDAGINQTLSANFVPFEDENFNSLAVTVNIDVSKADPVITWNDPDQIVFGTALDGVQLNAEADVDGSFVYNPVAGTVLDAGDNQSLAVNFTPTDDGNFNSVAASVSIDVAKADPAVSWNNPTAIVFGTALDDGQLNATANVEGAFVYSPAAGTVLDAGDNQTLMTTFAPTDGDNFNVVLSSVTIDVDKANPVISWTNPDDITVGTSLDATQLNATANVAGSFVYVPPAGTELAVGSDRPLTANFTPTDTANYNTVSATVVIDVLSPGDPAVNWSPPDAIVFGTALDVTQLNATSNVPGSFTYSPDVGTILDAGLAQLLSVTFVPNDTSAFNTVTDSVNIDVLKADAIITWSDPADIVFGVALDDIQLNATADVAGTFDYIPVAGTLLDAGTGQTLTVNFTPDDSANIQSASASVTINVAKADPVISWDDPADIIFNTPLGATQLNATASVDGAFTYDPASGTILNAGENQTLAVNFAPSDSANFNAVSASTSINVLKADPVITWQDPEGIVFGTALDETQLNATADIDGTFVYDPLSGVVLEAGDNQSLMVSFTPTDVANYNSVAASVSINVAKADPVLTWNDPADITFGTPLDETQLNAVADVDGAFVYAPQSGTLLDAGAGQSLMAVFTPTDTTNYNSGSANVAINVVKANPVIVWNNPDDIVVGTSLSSTQLNASANTDGTFEYSPVLGTTLAVGLDQPLTLTFTPDDTVNFNDATVAVRIDVLSADDPAVNWLDPAAIVFGTALDETQLNAMTDIVGTLVYSPPLGTILNAGIGQTLSVTFTPDDNAFNTVSDTVTIDVLKADPVISWQNPADIRFAVPLSTTQLNATADMSGSFTYDPAIGTVLPLGGDQTLNTTFVPDDAANFNSVSASVTINVLPGLDFGDAPGVYPVSLASDGARHITSGLFFGAAIDADSNGQPSVSADGDDNDAGGDDEDGVTVVAQLVTVAGQATTASFLFNVSGESRLDAWIDFNADGDWDDTGEQIFESQDLSAGPNVLNYSVPEGATVGDTYARFRLSTAGNLMPTGEAADGEVEDYVTTILDGSSAPPVTVSLADPAALILIEGGDLVVRSGQTDLFSAPSGSVGQLTVSGTESFDQFTLDFSDDNPVPGGGLNLDGLGGGNELVLVGPGIVLDLTSETADLIRNIKNINLADENSSLITIDAQSVTGLSPDDQTIHVVGSENDELQFSDAPQWRMTDPMTVDGRFILTAGNADGGQRVEADLPHAWQNFIVVHDVNNDGKVSASDALSVVNELGRRLFSDAGTSDLNDPASVVPWAGVYFDLTGDDKATALDALRVINQLARQVLEGEQTAGEAESLDVASLTRSSAAGSMGDARSVDELRPSDIDDPAVVAGTAPKSQRVSESTGDGVNRNAAPLTASTSEPATDAAALAVDQLLSDRAFLDNLR